MRIETGRFIRSAFSEADFVRDGLPQIAFVGRSNVGKSSLLNRLLGRRALARTSSAPGRTRSINYFLVNSSFYFVDLPGYGYAKVGKRVRKEWAELMSAYFNRADAIHTVLLVDGKVGATSLDCQAHEYLRSLGISRTVVATKIDKVRRGRRQRSLTAVRKTLGLAGGECLFPFSARTGEGVREIWRELRPHVGPASLGPSHASANSERGSS